MQEKQTDAEIHVKFKPFYGIRPGVYLTVLYSFILLLILFFLLLYPGLKNPGAVLIVKTEPAGAAVRIDDVYRGVAGSKIPISKGNHTIEAVMPGFESQSAVHEIPARYFGSLFFPLRYKVEFTLNTQDPVAAFAYYASDYATWTFAGEPTASWQIPMSLSEGAYRTGYAKDSNDDMQQMLIAASGFAVTKAAVRDLIRAKILLDNCGNAPSPVALVNSISGIFAFLSENPGAAKWLSQVLPREQASIVESSDWFKKQPKVANSGFTASFKIKPSAPTGSQRLAGVNFIRFSSGFMISETPVSRSLFETFLDENPQWREQQTDYFPQEISSYPWEIDKNIITGVTWYAAQAFCEWMALRLPQTAGMEVRLPTEVEWSIAAQNIDNMKNIGWEWCYDPYSPLQIAAVSHQAKQLVGSPERSLRGRQTANSAETRASLPPDLSSPIVTFRIVISTPTPPELKLKDYE
ncbi:formylglycine-generating enzyme family protein [Treponema sp. R80B11-R83G3]